ncbi:transglycosylase domain-containing protein [Oscillochloris sp. ZM17-4]|uniref:transglycosylase domain-containing protein n=1 Tax=Oscillochloris sp. ZM17-4 TaxID=2866714 RepID=UPI001C73B8A2|nr:transglycosylase domain-containing protein [Oscillochloris sp. ZM17-4]MBX0328108.1 transglycosylase domain-containing protein [Oscillochloris sp. ZM17-4]
MARQPRAQTIATRRLWRPALRIAGLLLLAGLLFGGYLWVSTPLPEPGQIWARASLGNTRILDRGGRLLYAVPDPLSGRQQPVPLSAIPLALQQATVAVEDASFYQNPGVDLRGIARAAWQNLRSGEIVAGGSTITQQLARTILLDPREAQRQSLGRKLREAVLALKLSASFGKGEILSMYLNQVYYGGLSYGVEAAAQRTFGKPASDLDLAEAALLAGLPQAPGRYDPFSQPDLAAARQAQVLDAMAREGFITAEEAERAKAEPLQLHGAAAEMRAPHFVGYVLDTLTAALGPDTVLRGGLTITTTLDADLQDAAQEVLRRQIERLSSPRDGGLPHRVSGGAVVVLDPRDGAILAMVGSPDFADRASAGQVNAALALRQPGSAIKPLTYAAALERGWTPATTILDVPSSFATREGRPYAPENYDSTFHGPLSLREALATSSNVAAVRALDHIGVPALLEMAQRLGITSLGQDSARYGLSLTLGSGELRPLELTAAFAAFANGGSRVTPYSVMSISGAATPGHAGPEPALSPQVAYLISDILSDRYARMRAFGVESPLDIGRPAAAKTGTTTDWRDNWTVGYTPDRAVGVWVGNADGEPMKDVSGISGAGPVWHDVMLAAHRGLPARDFARPAGIVELSVCAEGGMLPGPACPASRLERFVAGTEPRQPDTTHVALRVDRLLGCLAPAGYPAARTTTRIFRRLPPEAAAWGRENGIPAPPAQPCRQEGGPTPTAPQANVSAGDVAAGPTLISPAAGSVYRMSAGVPADRQQIVIEAVGGGTNSALTIVIDGEPVAQLSGPPYHAFWQLAPGEHRAWAEAGGARSAEVRFTVIR